MLGKRKKNSPPINLEEWRKKARERNERKKNVYKRFVN
jgi:hypothetical protein